MVNLLTSALFFHSHHIVLLGSILLVALLSPLLLVTEDTDATDVREE